MSCVIDGEEIDAMSAGSRRYRTFAGIALAVAVLAFWECRILSADEPNGSATAELFGDLKIPSIHFLLEFIWLSLEGFSGFATITLTL